MEDYVQMTLDDWMKAKDELRKELQSVTTSFVRIGYMLRRISDGQGYLQEGYNSVAEFAKAEYGLEPSTTSRFIAINKEYSEGGYSKRLKDEYLGMGRSQLEEMLKLPEPDRAMIREDTPREDIRELKRFNKAEPSGEKELYAVIEKFYEANPEILNSLFEALAAGEGNNRRLAEIVNPSGNKSYRRGMYFIMMHEDKISVKKYGSDPEDMTWEQWILITELIFEDTAAGAKTWENHFGGGEDADKGDSDKATAGDPVPETGRDHAEPEVAEAAADRLEMQKQAEEVQSDSREGQRSAGGDKEGVTDGEKTGDTVDENNDPHIYEADDTPGEAAGEVHAGGSGAAGMADDPDGREREGHAEDDRPAETAEEIDRRAGDVQGNDRGRTEVPECENLVDKDEIAPAQKPAETLSFSASEEPEVMEKSFGSRWEYLRSLDSKMAAGYLVKAYLRRDLQGGQLWTPEKMQAWLDQEVDDTGKTIGEEYAEK